MAAATATVPAKKIQPPKVKDQPMFIGGKWVDSQSGKTFPTLNPATGETICQVAEGDKADIDLAVSWVLADPQVFLLTTGDVDVLPKLLDAAERAGERPSDEQMSRLELAPLFT